MIENAIIKIPKRHYKYLLMLVEARVYPNEEIALSKVLERGLDEAKFDAAYAGGPDMEMDLLMGQQMSIKVPDNSEHLESLGSISRGYNVPISKAATIVFLQGLFEHYLELKSSHLYAENERFRKNVDMMPHDSFYDGPESE